MVSRRVTIFFDERLTTMAKAQAERVVEKQVDAFSAQLMELRRSMAERMRHLKEETPHFEMTPQDLVGSVYPQLAMWTLCTCDIDDYDKKNGWSCWVDTEGWHGLLNARGFGMRRFFTAETLESLLEAMERFLSREDQDWTYYAGQRSKRSRGRSSTPYAGKPK